jgi:hypothetical protein
VRKQQKTSTSLLLSPLTSLMLLDGVFLVDDPHLIRTLNGPVDGVGSVHKLQIESQVLRVFMLSIGANNQSPFVQIFL